MAVGAEAVGLTLMKYSGISSISCDKKGSNYIFVRWNAVKIIKVREASSPSSTTWRKI